MSYDLFTRTTTRNHYAVTQEIFTRAATRTATSSARPRWARSPRPPGGRCPTATSRARARSAATSTHAATSATTAATSSTRTDLISPRSKINGETPEFRETEQFFLDLPAFAEVLGHLAAEQERASGGPTCSSSRSTCSDDLQPRAITRDLDWGVPVPLDGWRDRPDKRIYVWFDAVIGYLSASIEWARRSGDPDAWRAWWQDAGRRVLLLHGQGQHRLPLRDLASRCCSATAARARSGGTARPARRAEPADRGGLQRVPAPWRAASSPPPATVVIYVRDFLARYDVDALRYYVAVAEPETQDTDFTWSEFVRRNNDELVATWGNLVNRSVSFAAENIGEIPAPGELTGTDRDILGAFPQVVRRGRGDLERSHFKAAITEAMRTVAEANKYMSDQAPWKLRESDPERMRTVMHVVLQLVDDAKTLLTPFLPRSSAKVHAMLGGQGRVGRDAADRAGGRGRRPVLPGDHRRLRQPRPLGERCRSAPAPR